MNSSPSFFSGTNSNTFFSPTLDPHSYLSSSTSYHEFLYPSLYLFLACEKLSKHLMKSFLSMKKTPVSNYWALLRGSIPKGTCLINSGLQFVTSLLDHLKMCYIMLSFVLGSRSIYKWCITYYLLGAYKGTTSIIGNEWVFVIPHVLTVVSSKTASESLPFISMFESVDATKMYLYVCICSLIICHIFTGERVNALVK